ncbi:MAG: hypothetical protein LUH22_12140 [Bacteroides sp.]|nr:hypothetical protein [Bacteroides sp.]
MAPLQNDTYKILLDIIKQKVPQKTKLANQLADILLIEKEAVYRRLRGEVPFTFTEIVKISRVFNISLDTIIGINSSRSHPFQLKFTRYFNPIEVDYAMHEEFTDIVGQTKNDVHSEAGFTAGVLPLHFTLNYEQIQRFYTLRWLYQFGDSGTKLTFSKIFFPERLRGLFQRYLIEVEHFRYTYFIFDKCFLINLVNDINYFHSIRLISKDEIILLKDEIRKFLDDFERMAIHGKFKNGNKIDVYISSLNFENTYSYMQTNQYRITMIKAFTYHELSSLDEVVFDKTKKWLQALKRTSVLISGSNEMSRILFFEEQRKILEKEL